MCSAVVPPQLPGLADANVAGRRALVRVDYNIPGGADGVPVDDFRIRASVETLKFLVEKDAKVILLTHRGRPQGVPAAALSTKPLVPVLEKVLAENSIKTKVHWAADCVGRMAEQAVESLPPGEILLLENTRFHLGDPLNQQAFVQQLARLGDVFVNEAFPALHRAHASLSGLSAAMAEVVLGFNTQKELGWLTQLLGNVKRPLLVMVGGSHIGPKLEWLQRMLGHVDHLMVGGAIAHTLLAARDMPLGLSHFEPAFVEVSRDFITEAGVIGSRLLLPVDLRVAHRDAPEVPVGVRLAGRLESGDVAHDIGPETIKTWKNVIANSQSILWLGSMGSWEKDAYRAGTLELASAIAGKKDAFSIVGGDGLLQVLDTAKMRSRMPQVSAGAAVWMAALSGQPLPSLQVMAARGKGWHGEERRATPRNS